MELEDGDATTESLAASKLEAVKLVRELGVSGSQTARDLDLHENMLRKWVREQATDPKSAFSEHGIRKARAAGVERLHRELARMKRERDILEKAATYLEADVHQHLQPDHLKRRIGVAKRRRWRAGAIHALPHQASPDYQPVHLVQRSHYDLGLMTIR